MKYLLSALLLVTVVVAGYEFSGKSKPSCCVSSTKPHGGCCGGN